MRGSDAVDYTSLRQTANYGCFVAEPKEHLEVFESRKSARSPPDEGMKRVFRRNFSAKLLGGKVF